MFAMIFNHGKKLYITNEFVPDRIRYRIMLSTIVNIHNFAELSESTGFLMLLSLTAK